jgi:hypothetical protein
MIGLHIFQLGSLNVDGVEYDIHPMAKNPGFKRKKRYARRRYGDSQQSHNGVPNRYLTPNQDIGYRNPFVQTKSNSPVHSNKFVHSNQHIRETQEQEFNPQTYLIDSELERQILEYPGQPTMEASGGFHENNILPDVAPPKRRRLYAAFRKEAKKEIKGDCLGRSMCRAMVLIIHKLNLSLTCTSC